jgi:hypothetical protein
MLLRGVIPLGWMPGSQGALMALCTANGLIEVRRGSDAGLPDGLPPATAGSSAYKICSFAAVMPLGCTHAAPPQVLAIAHAEVIAPAASPFAPAPRFGNANPPRAPPIG